MMRVHLNTKSLDDYDRFLKIKRLPSWAIRGSDAYIPDQYASEIGLTAAPATGPAYSPEPFLFDYQRDIAAMALERKKFAVFADCGLGKTLILLSYAREVLARTGRKVLVVTPKLVVPQMVGEAQRFWGDDLPVTPLAAKSLGEWLNGDSAEIGITNYEAIKPELPAGSLGGLILDESSMLKNHYGKWAAECLRLGRGVQYKLALTGTPAPNDRIEYANHAVFLDRFPTVNAFLATYFVNRGETSNRWEIKPHAVGPFYRQLSAWCIFLSDPATYGWEPIPGGIPPVKVHIHDVEMTAEQNSWVRENMGSLIATRTGGITMRAAYGQVGKGFYKGQEIATNKYETMATLVEGWPEESTIVWCIYDNEQKKCKDALGGHSMDGSTPDAVRSAMVKEFQNGDPKVLISKPRILGFGLNLQIATRQIFSGLQDSFESYYQAVKRSNRIGSTRPLNVHIPVTEIERPLVENVLRKADRVQADTEMQEALFRDGWQKT